MTDDKSNMLFSKSFNINAGQPASPEGWTAP